MDAPPDYRFLTANEQKTVELFGKPYHWGRVNGTLRLLPGVNPSENALSMGELARLATQKEQ